MDCLYLSVREEENHVLALDASHLVQFSQVVVETVVVVAATELDLEAAVAAHVGSQSCERLLPCPAHADQEGIAALLPNHAGDSGRKTPQTVKRLKASA